MPSCKGISSAIGNKIEIWRGTVRYNSARPIAKASRGGLVLNIFVEIQEPTSTGKYLSIAAVSMSFTATAELRAYARFCKSDAGIHCPSRLTFTSAKPEQTLAPYPILKPHFHVQLPYSLPGSSGRNARQQLSPVDVFHTR